MRRMIKVERSEGRGRELKIKKDRMIIKKVLKGSGRGKRRVKRDINPIIHSSNEKGNMGRRG